MHTHLLYLDHSAEQAAEWVRAQHVERYAHAALLVLSAPWHWEDSAAYADMDSPPRRWRVTHKNGPGWGSYYLDRKAIAHPLPWGHPWGVWVSESAENYVWAAQFLTGLMSRMPAKHALRTSLAVLSQPCPHVPEGGATEPPVNVGEPVVVDGYVDAVASYRQYFERMKT